MIEEKRRRSWRATILGVLAALAGATVVAVVPATGAYAATQVSSTEVTWSLGTYSPGQTHTTSWHNINPNLVYTVGLQPIGATTSAACVYQVTRTWYVEETSGNTDLGITVQNVGSLTCGVNILLSWKAATTSWTSSAVDAGATQNGELSNIPDSGSAYQVGLVPIGATSSTACQFQITDIWYTQSPTDPNHRNLWFHLTNVGSIACSTKVAITSYPTTIDYNDGVPESFNSGEEASYWGVGLSDVGDTAVFLPGLVMGTPSPSGTCQFEVTKMFYSEVVSSQDQRGVTFDAKNIGGVACNLFSEFASLD